METPDSDGVMLTGKDGVASLADTLVVIISEAIHRIVEADGRGMFARADWFCSIIRQSAPSAPGTAVTRRLYGRVESL